MSSGTRFLIDLHGCKVGIRLGERFSVEAIVMIIQKNGMTVKNASLVPYPDGTINCHVDLGESHFSFGTYDKDNHLSGEMNVCNENRNNRRKGRKTVRAIAALFGPTKVEVTEIPWRARSRRR